MYPGILCATIMLMIVVLLVVVGLCLGSFVNALIWRLHEQDVAGSKKRPDKKYLAQLSIIRGRSMCSACHHSLAAKDLIPVVSWLMLRGKCRYCRKPITDNPLIELCMPLLFVASYLWWPVILQGWQWGIFAVWLTTLAGLVALVVYDVRWLLLPNRIIYPLMALAGLGALIAILTAGSPWRALLNCVAAVAVGGGIFYLLFQVSGGKWIGGGDVRLGWLLGLVVATPARSLLFIFFAALGGSLVSLPLLMEGRLKRSSVIPFGPFLIAGAILVQLFGGNILTWYQHVFLGLG
jgi:leader peptidase (prepilin peptidase) / N-methyltransferase